MLQREVSTKRNHEDMKLTSNPTATMAMRQAVRTARLAVMKGSCDEDDEQQDWCGVAMKIGINVKLWQRRQ